MFLWRVYIPGNNKSYWGIHVKCPIYLSGFKPNLCTLNSFPWKSQILNFTEIRPAGAALIYAGQTDVHDEANRRFLRLCLKDEIQSNSDITSWKGLNILCRYKRVLFFFLRSYVSATWPNTYRVCSISLLRHYSFYNFQLAVSPPCAHLSAI
jgi:hypothetical protein